MPWKKVGWTALIAIVGLGLLGAAGAAGYQLGVTRKRAQSVGPGAMQARLLADRMLRFGEGWPGDPEGASMAPGRGQLQGPRWAAGWAPLDGKPWLALSIFGLGLFLGLVLLASAAGAFFGSRTGRRASSEAGSPIDNHPKRSTKGKSLS